MCYSLRLKIACRHLVVLINLIYHKMTPGVLLSLVLASAAMLVIIGATKDDTLIVTVLVPGTP